MLVVVILSAKTVVPTVNEESTVAVPYIRVPESSFAIVVFIKLRSGF